jgi:hypothetical protein
MERETKDSGRKTKLPKKLKEDLMFLRTPDNPTHTHPPLMLLQNLTIQHCNLRRALKPETISPSFLPSQGRQTEEGLNGVRLRALQGVASVCVWKLVMGLQKGWQCL